MDLRKITYGLAVASAIAAYFNWTMLFVCLMFFMLYLFDNIMELLSKRQEEKDEFEKAKEQERIHSIERKLVSLENAMTMVKPLTRRDWRG